jgi:hypothetical protein
LDEEKSAVPEQAPGPDAGEPGALTAEAKVETEHPAVTPALDEAKEEALEVAGAHSKATVAESDVALTVSRESPETDEGSREPRGTWGSFWRRRTND